MNRASTNRDQDRDADKPSGSRSGAFCFLVFLVGVVLLMFAALAVYFVAEGFGR